MQPYSYLFLYAKIGVRSFLAVVLVLCFLIGEASGARVWAAQGRAIFSVQPVTYDPSVRVPQSYFIFNALPGTHIENRVRVSNTGTIEGTADIYGVDATTGQTSGAVYLSRTAPRSDVGAWLTLGKEHLTLKAGESQIISFQLRLPRGLRSGQHIGGIVVENKDIQKALHPKSLQINMQDLAIVAVQVNLPGPSVYRLKATGITPGGANSYQALVVKLQNTGTMMLWPSGSLQVIEPSSGRVLRTLQIKLDTFLPQTTIAYPVYLTGKALGVGTYQTHLELHYTAGNTLRYTTQFTMTTDSLAKVFSSVPTTAPSPMSSTAFPFWLPIVGGFCFVLAGSTILCFWIFGRARRKRMKKAGMGKQTHTITQ